MVILFVLFLPSVLFYGYAEYPESGAFFSLICMFLVVLYGLAALVPSVSMLTRRMHDAGLSGWWWLLYLTIFLPGMAGYIWSAAVLVFALLPTKTADNPYHKYNK